VVAFITSLVVTFAMVGVVFWVGKRRPPDAVLTWGEAFVAATFVFFLLLLIYGIVPNQWLLWADNELGWRKDTFFFGDDGITFFGRGAILFPQEVLRDIVATLIYVVGLGVNGFMWTWWQRRGKKAAQRPELTSAFGRPLVKKA
jgi:hypothetical protein